jgi:hypothetical protein
MKELLCKCEPGDFEYLSTVLDSYLSFTNGRRRRELLGLSTESPQSQSNSSNW